MNVLDCIWIAVLRYEYNSCSGGAAQENALPPEYVHSVNEKKVVDAARHASGTKGSNEEVLGIKSNARNEYSRVGRSKGSAVLIDLL
jgi:hypothetical protein